MRMVKPKLFRHSHRQKQKGDEEGGLEENSEDQLPLPPVSATSMEPDLTIIDGLALNKTKYDANNSSSLLRRYAHIISFFVYISVGTLFYDLHPGNGAYQGPSPSGVLGFYEAITIGYSVGLSPKNPDYV